MAVTAYSSTSLAFTTTAQTVYTSTSQRAWTYHYTCPSGSAIEVFTGFVAVIGASSYWGFIARIGSVIFGIGLCPRRICPWIQVIAVSE